MARDQAEELSAVAIEKIDEMIVGPMLRHLQDLGEPWRILVLPDHPTPLRLRTHTSDPVPFAMAGTGVVQSRKLTYSENHARETGSIGRCRTGRLPEYAP